MEIRSILILMIVALGILVVPVAADTRYGPDHYTLQKNGTLDLSAATNGYLNQDMIVESYTPTADLVRSVLIINCTLKKYPIQFSLPSVISTAPTIPWSSIPPALEAKFVFKESGTTHVMANLTLIAYKQTEPYVNYYGYFTYVNTPYLNTKTGNIQSDLPTIIYDNITNGGTSPNLKPVFAGDTVNLTKITDIAGFYWASTGAASTPPQLWVDPSGNYYTMYSLNSQIEYGVTNNPTNYDKIIMINRPNGEQSNLQIYQNSTRQYESGSTTINESHLIFPSTHGIFKIWVNVTTLSYTIFDDNISAYTPPPPPGPATWDLNVRVYDASTGGLYAGSRVDKTDNTDPTLNGWDINTGGISIFQVITGHNYTFTASATGMISDSDYYDAVPTITTLILTLRKDLGSTASYAEFLVVDNQSRRINGASVYLSDGQGLTTRNGYALFNITTGLNYGYEVSKTAFDTQNGNFTAVAGSNYKLIVLYPAGTGATGQPIETSITITDPREAARQSMEMGYTLIPSFFMLALLVLLMAMLGFNPADIGKRRGGKR